VDLGERKKQKNPAAGNDVIRASKTRGNEICPKSKKSLLRRGGRNYVSALALKAKFSRERASLVSPVSNNWMCRFTSSDSGIYYMSS
jgi:hypothetical protein